MLVLVSFVGYLSLNYSTGPANNGQTATGAPFDFGNTCISCHSPGTSYNATLSIELLDGATPVTTYTAGNSYTLRITRSANSTYNSMLDAGFGFQLTCATGENYDNDNDWGTLPTNTANIFTAGRNYIEHSQKLAKTITQLDFPWTAPISATAGDAKFYVSLNTVNGDGTNSNDQVINDSLIITAPLVCPTPSVSVTASSTSICSGSNVTFTTTTTNGGSNPTYQWLLNGVSIYGETNSTYSSSNISDNDAVKVVMTPTAPCDITSAISNTITMSVDANLTPTVSIIESTNNICVGSSVVFTSTATNDGNNPSYVWKLNGNAISGATNDSYSTSSLANGDIVSLELTTSISCYASQTAISNDVTMVVNSNVTPSVSISASTNNICSGTSVSFIASATNGGISPSYQWKNNGNAINGATNSSYTSSSLANGDVISCTMNTSAACYTSQTANSNGVTMVVNSNVTPSVSVSASTNNICSGTSVSFTASATNGGNSPSYQWKNNGTAIIGATNSSYSSSALTNSDVISCMLTTSVACYTSQTANSNGVTMFVNSNVTPTVSVSASTNNICSGTSVSFTASATNGGNNPSYQWVNNGNAISGATNSSFSSSSLANGDVINCTMATSAACYTSSTATSNSVTMVVNSSVTPTVSITASSTTACAGSSVSFSSIISNGGNAPSYQWRLNNNTISGATNSSYSSSSLVNSDAISLSVISNASCVSNSNANSNSISMTINQANGSISGGPLALCNGGHVTLSAGIGSNYIWSNNATTQSINAFSAGTYSVTYFDNNGCAVTASKTVVAKSLPTSVVISVNGLTTVCEPNSVLYTVSPGSAVLSGFDYQWNLSGTPINGATDTFYNATSGSGSVTLTISGSTCSKTSNSKMYTVKPKPSASFSAGGATTFCTGSSVTLNAPVISGYTYTWLNNGASVGGGNSKVIKTAGNYTVVAKLSGCADTAQNTLAVVINALPIASVVNLTSSSFCDGDSCVIQAFPAGGNSYQWMNGTSVAATTSVNSYATHITGSYKVIVTDGNGCISKALSSSVKTKNSPLPAATITPLSSTTISSIGSVKLNASPSMGVTWQWYKNGVAISGAIAKQYTATSGGSYTVAITKNGCTGISSATLVTQTGNKTAFALTNESNFELAVYPNPVSNELQVSINGIENPTQATIEIMDVLGHLVAAYEKEVQQNFSLDMSHLLNGNYFLRYKDVDGRTSLMKITKQ